MKKKWFFLLLFVVLTGCSNQEGVHNEKIKVLKSEISQLEEEKETLLQDIRDIKIEKGIEKYVLTLEIKQKHHFDIGKMIKDNMNAIELQIPVDKEYYDSLEVGDVLDDTFRLGSLFMEGSFGSWKIEVVNKEIM